MPKSRRKSQVAENTTVNRLAMRLGSKNAGGKNEGKFNYVVENTYRKNVRLLALHYVDENKLFIVVSPLC